MKHLSTYNDQIYLIHLAEVEDTYGGFKPSTLKLLEQNGMTLIGHLVTKNKEELLSIRGFGEVSFRELASALSFYGVKIGEQIQ